MFTKSAEFYDALYHFKDYESACRQLHQIIQDKAPGSRTMLDVACGTGKHLSYLKSYYKAEGLDIDPNLLAIARKRLPEITFHNGDMTDFSLPLTYDVVACLFSSIGYVRTVEQLQKAVMSMAGHLHTGGLLLIEPWISPEKYWVGKLTYNKADLPDLKIAWMYISEQEGLTSVFDIHFMVGTPAGITEFREQHIMGLWTDEEYRSAFERAGVSVEYDPVGPFGRGLFYGVKKA